MSEDKKKKYQLWTVSDPNRPPYWRYERVQYLLDKEPDKQVFLSDDDVACRYFFLCCQELAKQTTPEERHLLKKKYPGIIEALNLRKYSSLDTLGLLEGYMLTDVDLGWLSAKFSLSPATVAWYEQLYYDCWSRREANAWVETEVLRPKEYPGSQEFKPSPSFDRACAYRIFGYHGGLLALELFSTGFLSTDAKPLHRELAETFIQRALETSVSNEGAVMGYSRRRLNKTEGEFIKLGLDLATKAAQAGHIDVLQNVQKALSSVAPLVGDSVKEELTRLAEKNSDIAALLVGAAELRYQDQIRLSLGLEMSPETKQLVTDFNENRRAG